VCRTLLLVKRTLKERRKAMPKFSKGKEVAANGNLDGKSAGNLRGKKTTHKGKTLSKSKTSVKKA
jgi:hypothetical protein